MIDLSVLLATMEPDRVPGEFVFATAPEADGVVELLRDLARRSR